MRYLLVALSLLLGAAMPARAQVSLDIHLPGIDLGINAATYPQLVLIPGYPVYYDPRAASNYFFYDGLYWVYQADTWYAEHLVQRAVGRGAARGRALVPAARSRALLPPAAIVLPRMERRRATALGRALGQRLGKEPLRLGPMGPSLRASRRAVADLSAPVFGQSLSARGPAASRDSRAQLQV